VRKSRVERRKSRYRGREERNNEARERGQRCETGRAGNSIA